MQATDLPPESERLFTWKPNPGQQTKFLASSAFEVLFGGSAGPGKSEALLVCPLRWVHIPRFNGIIFRRTFPELEKSLIPRARELYKAVVPGADYNEQKKLWTFPSGAKIYFGHLEHEHDAYSHRSSEYQFVGFDELTMFTEKQYVYMLSRARTSTGIPIRIRSASNPGGPGHEWVFQRWGQWLDPEHKEPIPPDGVKWYVNGDKGEEDVPRGTVGALSRQFIPGLLKDNPYADTPEYRQQLMSLDVVTRRQLLHGDWTARPAAGLYFRRAWFTFLDARPTDATIRVRRWDLASTEGGGDWTVGVLMSRQDSDRLVVEDVVRVQMRPAGVQETILATANVDPPGTRIVLPQDPGQAGVAQADYYAKALMGYDVRFERETGDKVTRAQPFSAQCEAKNVSLVRAPWNEPFLQSLEAFPDSSAHDDDVDAASGAFNSIAMVKRTAMDLWMEIGVDDY